jgi:SAM-dependent methyltransferase
MALYDRIGVGYDRFRRADAHIAHRLFHLVRNESEGSCIATDLYLDVACGSGNYTIALSEMGLRMVGIDQSETMIAAARQKSGDVRWSVADAERLPFPDHTFAGAVCTLAIHHFSSLEPVFAEVYRTLRSGKFVIFTATKEQMARYWLNEYFPEAMRASIDRMPSASAVAESLKKAGFQSVSYETYEVTDQLQDLFLYSGKHRPELYLNPEIRAGISTFAALADPDEVEDGCRKLERDIETGRIRKVIERYQSDSGDYLFAVAEK